MRLLAIAVAFSPLHSWADSQMYKQMESRRLVPTNEDVLFHQIHTEIRPTLTGLHPVSQITTHIHLLSAQSHPAVTQPWMVTTEDGIEKTCSARSIHVYFTKQFICPERKAAQRALLAIEQTA